MFKHSHLTREARDKGGRRSSNVNVSRSKSQPNVGSLKPAMSASLQSFMALNTRNHSGIPSHRSVHVLSRSAHPKKPPVMSIASSINGSTLSNASPEPPRFNPFAPATTSAAGSNLTLSSVDSNNVILDEDGSIVSAGPETIWKMLLPTREYTPSRRLVFTMLLNLRSFVSPSEVMQKLIQNVIFEQNSNSANFRKQTSSRLFKNVFEFVEEWVLNIPYDFRDETMRERLAELFSLCTVDPNDRQQMDGLMEALHSALARREHYENALQSLRQSVEDPPERSPIPCGLVCLGASPLVVAQQLAQIEMERLQMIGPDEIVDMLSNSTLDNLQQPKGVPGQLRNIEHYIQFFNHLSSLVATEILRHQHKRHRVRTIEWFIDLGMQCVNIANFNSLMAVVAGLTTSAVSRLKRTWCRVEKAKLDILQHQLNPSANFSSYRATLNAAIWRYEHGKHESEKVIIPFFGLLLKDLYYINCACLEPLSNGQLNIAMFNQFADHMSNLVKWKGRQCPFKRNANVLQYVLLGATYNEKNMLLLSYDYESPDNSAERDEYKRLSDERESK
ncbi:Ras-GEF domain-containing family member 1B-A [Aphelenchoides besseyi]|nr:Ras-GEF domain-containing family member 1B-A [Aphelenchoides besseyi]